MGKKQRIARLEAAVAHTRTAIAGADLARVEEARSELLAALVDEPEHGSAIGGHDLYTRITERQEELVEAQLQQRLTACPCCRGTELLVSKQTLDLPFDVGRARLVVCRACGDARLQAEDPAAVAESTGLLGSIKLMRTITLPARPTSPFR